MHVNTLILKLIYQFKIIYKIINHFNTLNSKNYTARNNISELKYKYIK